MEVLQKPSPRFFFFFLTFYWSDITCFLESWPLEKFIASSGDDKSGTVPAQRMNRRYSVEAGLKAEGGGGARWKQLLCFRGKSDSQQRPSQLYRNDCSSFTSCYLLG